MSFSGRRLSPTTAGDTLLTAMSRPSLPDIFCWTRFGTEAGEDMPRILQRKEVERLAHHGLFYWGIGNSVGRAIRELANLTRDPEVLFSPIIGRPRPVDVAPGQVVRWSAGETLEGERHQLPDTALVTSRAKGEVATRHYALVCWRAGPLVPDDLGEVHRPSLRNLLSGKPLGASQVTAVVRRVPQADPDGRRYVVAMRARLVPPFFITLREGVVQDVEPRRGPGWGSA
jgi:hypothetical protein